MQYLATKIVHWPTGPVHACEEHAKRLIGLSNFRGSHVGVTESDGTHECSNCVNVNRKTQKSVESANTANNRQSNKR